MKKLTILVGIILFTGSYANTTMSVGDLLSMYFEELLPKANYAYTGVQVSYTDIHQNPRLKHALERAIFHGMLPDESVALSPGRTATVAHLSTLLGYHFGVRIPQKPDSLTLEQYNSSMNLVRGRYAYTLIQHQNEILGQMHHLPDYAITQVSNFPLLDEVFVQLKKGHYEANTVSDEELIYGAARGIADAYRDPFTKFLDPVDVDMLNNSMSGDYAGIGAYVSQDENGNIIITGTLPDSPARTAGLQAGDQILAIDGVNISSDVNLVDVIADIVGPEGTTVEILILRNKEQTALRLTRARIHVPFVRDGLLDTGEYYIALYSIGTGADQEFAEALLRLQDSGAMKFILDLRDNPGGTLGETRVILDALIPKSKRIIVIRTQEETLYMYSYNDPLIDLSQYDVGVLINGGTASAAEIIVGTLDDYFPDEIRLIGEPTYGKGSIQQLLSFTDGSGLKFTIAHWLTGLNKRGVDGVGFTPEYLIGFRDDLWERGIDVQLEQAKKILSKY